MIERACTICGALSPSSRCPTHTRKPWSDRPARDARSQLSGSAQQARSRYVIDRDNSICHRCGHAGANEADHVIPLAEGGRDDVTNLKAIHGRGSGSTCHADKTAEEAARGRGGG